MNSSHLLNRLLASGLADASSIHGCSEQELSQIESVACHRLPRSYLDFMRAFGKGAGRFLQDVDFLFPAVLGFKSTAVEILGDYEEYALSLPENSFVFSIRTKEQFAFFDFEVAEPPVMFYASGDSKFSRAADSFWDFIEGELHEAERAYSQIKGTPYDLRESR